MTQLGGEVVASHLMNRGAEGCEHSRATSTRCHFHNIFHCLNFRIRTTNCCDITPCVHNAMGYT